LVGLVLLWGVGLVLCFGVGWVVVVGLVVGWGLWVWWVVGCLGGLLCFCCWLCCWWLGFLG
ncbi:hypothetical protein RA269_28130, partial [Pseudomonas syringae pv. tagetis]|uniref:hypothetical protein n=1 Tax=Pseudomonas syringae group genomosp. 7 TaxID=251699 RepID=UPI00376F656A